NGAATLCASATLSVVGGNDQATCPTSSLMAASSPYSITATYNGDSNFVARAASPALSQTVNKANTTTAVSSSANASVFGQSITFTATVSTAPPGSGTPTGTVQFSIDGSPFGSPVTLNGSGQATSGATSTLTVGTHA